MKLSRGAADVMVDVDWGFGRAEPMAWFTNEIRKSQAKAEDLPRHLHHIFACNFGKLLALLDPLRYVVGRSAAAADFLPPLLARPTPEVKHVLPILSDQVHVMRRHVFRKVDIP